LEQQGVLAWDFMSSPPTHTYTHKPSHCPNRPLSRETEREKAAEEREMI